MGYCYDDRGRLCCDICGRSGDARRMKCPVGYCPDTAACSECRKAKKHIPPDGSDADTAAKVLELTLTKRGEIRMAGFPYHQLDGYLAKLVAAGHRTALVEQVS